ncbi:MAG: SpaH/EbpB family LPXTG-anchored major pilin [Oscillospiraceae bacterium]|nr:SpaH/EbpB family LPXTG-anchored major pilin [Oscillospiraceae bacterium]
MNKIKKLASLVLALVMALALAAPAWASSGIYGNNGSITIDNAVEGQTYSVYQMFQLESYSDVTTENDADIGTVPSGNGVYKLADENWRGLFEGSEVGVGLITVDTEGYITDATGISEADAAKLAEFAKAALAWAKAQGINSVSSQKAASTTVTFSNLGLGYYLVDSTLGALCSLNTTVPNATIKEKNDEPTNEKQVAENNGGVIDPTDMDDTNDAQIGDILMYQSTIDIVAGVSKFVFHDKMSDSLTFINETTGEHAVTVQLLKAGETTPEGVTSGWTVKTNVQHVKNDVTTTDTFDIEFEDTFFSQLAAGDKVIITYYAKLNENAIVGGVTSGNGNDNESKITYGDDNGSETTPSKTRTYTWELDVFKYTEEGEDKKALSGAEFELKTENGTEPIKFVTSTNTGVYRVATPEQITAGGDNITTKLVSDVNGNIKIEGLDEGTYYLTETKAPNGYNKTDDPIKVVITSEKGDGLTMTKKLEVEGKNATTGETELTSVDRVEVVNNSGTLLPSTGGIGTTIFYIVGGVLAAGAVVLLITKRRMNIDKD